MSRTYAHTPPWVVDLREGEEYHNHARGECQLQPPGKNDHRRINRSRHRNHCKKYLTYRVECQHGIYLKNRRDFAALSTFYTLDEQEFCLSPKVSIVRLYEEATGKECALPVSPRRKTCSSFTRELYEALYEEHNGYKPGYPTTYEYRVSSVEAHNALSRGISEHIYLLTIYNRDAYCECEKYLQSCGWEAPYPARHKYFSRSRDWDDRRTARATIKQSLRNLRDAAGDEELLDERYSSFSYGG